MIETVDDSVGQILEHLKYLGLSKNTIVIFYSDNGGDAGNKQLQAPLRGGKGWLYEGGIRVPLIVRWPVVVEKSSHSNALVTSTDFFPTFMEILGENDRKHSDSLDGESMLDLFRGLSKQSERTLFWHYPHYHGSGMKPAGASRKGKYKLIEWYGTSSCGDNAQIELYDLSTDIGETRNRAETLPDKTRELLRQMEGWRRDIGAQMPEDNPDFPSDEKCGT
jgi:arylsulfatase A-like enzyme